MIRSFRLRLALSSALLAGLTLAVFGLSAWWLVRNVEMERIDSTLRAYAERDAGRPPQPYEWDKEEDDIASSLNLQDAGDLILFVQDGQGEVLYRSSQWPANLDASLLPWPEPQAQRASSEGGGLLVGTAFAADAWQVAQLGPPPEGERPFRERPRRPPPRRPGDFSAPPAQRDDAPAIPPSLREEAARPAHDAASAGSGEQRDGQAQQEQKPDAAAYNPSAVPPVDSANQPEQHLPPLAPPQGPPPVVVLLDKTVDGQPWRIALAAGDHARVAVAVNLRTLDNEMRGVRNAFLIAMPIALALIGIGAWIFSGSALRPLKKLTAAARRVTAEGLNQRISVNGEDREFAELIEMFNGMLRRLERSFQQAHRFSADAAHELKTPLAILQGQLERAINNAEDGSPLQAELTGILDEVRRLSAISRKLLLLSQADAGRLKVHRESFNLSEALASLAEDTQMLAPHLKVSSEIQPGMEIKADKGLLQQVLHNLISNAIKYNVENGWIHIAARMTPLRAEVMVVNPAQGISQNERERVFERFYRADPARNQKIEGVGLGLALSREIVRAHGGDLSFSVDKEGNVQLLLALPC